MLKQLCASNFKNLSDRAGDQERILSTCGSESLHIIAVSTSEIVSDDVHDRAMSSLHPNVLKIR